MKNLSSAKQIGEQIKKGSFSKEEVANYFLERINNIDKKINSFVEVYNQPIYSQGSSPLTGVPIAIKDNICIAGKNITCASRILKNHKAVYDATVVARLKKAGLTIIGTTNMDEFAFGSSTENSCYGPTRNPWDLTAVPGGSSGGSAAAVAARLVPFALGSDTGGSIRQPAAFCGVVGMKPTYGRVSRYGLVAFGSSLDQIGPITTNVEDCALLLNIICGKDNKDSTSAVQPVPDFTKFLEEDLKGIKIGLPKEYFEQNMDKEVRNCLQQARQVLEKQGAEFVDVSLPHTPYAVATYYIIASSEASSNLQRFDGIRYGHRAESDNLYQLYCKSRQEGFGVEVKRRIFLGTYSLSSGYYDDYYLHALKVRRLISEDFDKAWSKVDIILTPTSPVPAFSLGEKISDPLSMYLSDIYTISANLAGVCAISLPCGFSSKGLPIGMQFIAPAFEEGRILQASYSYQQQTDFHLRIPEISKR